MKPTTRQQLIDYCLRNLGHPVIEINVSRDQLEDRVDEALQFYQEYHSDSMVKMYRKHQITIADETNKFIDVPDNIMFVSRILPVSKGSYGALFSSTYQMFKDDIFDLHSGGSGGLLHYDMAKQYMSLIDTVINGTPAIRFNRHMNRVFIDLEWSTDIKEGDYIILDCYETLDPNAYPDVYNDMFLKKYLTALIKRIWGQNMSKFENMQLPGGVTMNGRQILDDAINEIRELEEQMQLKYEMPPDFFIG